MHTVAHDIIKQLNYSRAIRKQDVHFIKELFFLKVTKRAFSENRIRNHTHQTSVATRETQETHKLVLLNTDFIHCFVGLA